MSDDQNSLLTSTQREFLRGESKHHPTDDAQGRMMRKRIRERIRPGLIDFTLLLEGYGEGRLTDDDLNKIFSLAGTEEDRDPMLDGVRDAIALFFLGTKDNPEPFDFETRLSGGIERAYEQEYEPLERPIVDVEFSTDEKPASTYPEIYSRLAAGEYASLSEGEMRHLFMILFESDLPVLGLVGRAVVERYGKSEGGFKDGEGLPLTDVTDFDTDGGEE